METGGVDPTPPDDLELALLADEETPPDLLLSEDNIRNPRPDLPDNDPMTLGAGQASVFAAEPVRPDRPIRPEQTLLPTPISLTPPGNHGASDAVKPTAPPADAVLSTGPKPETTRLSGSVQQLSVSRPQQEFPPEPAKAAEPRANPQPRPPDAPVMPLPARFPPSSETAIRSASERARPVDQPAQPPRDRRPNPPHPALPAAPVPATASPQAALSPPFAPFQTPTIPPTLGTDPALAPIAEPTAGLLASSSDAPRATSVGPAAVPGSLEQARHVSQQLSVAVARTGPGTTDIALNPPELGRVRLTLTAQDTTVVLHIMADRPETTDLLRRHIDMLAQEFRDIGYSSLSFTFGDGKPSANASASQDSVPSRPLTDTDEADVGRPRSATLAVGGLDLRL